MRRLIFVLSLFSSWLVVLAANGQEDQPKKPRPLQNPKSKSAMTIEKTSFGKTKDGQQVELYTCKNAGGLVLKVMTYGATVVSMETPDKLGNVRNIQLSFSKLDGYLARHPYFGSTIGRYGNRIAGGKFKLDGKEFELATNNGPNHLHGGIKGFDAVVWQAEEVKTADAVGVKFTYTSKDGEEGYPGTLKVTATYTLTSANEMRIDYTATTDKLTVLNPTNHCYWNLGGAGSGKILEHQLTIHADKYLPIESTSIPTGELADVKGAAMDFTSPHTIGERIEELKKPPHQTKGYDHCYVLRGQDGKLALAAKVVDPASGRTMEIWTTEPGVQLYCGNFLDGSEGGGGYQQHDAFCLETQHFPDSPNQPKFPTTVLKPGQTFKSTTVHKFGVQK
ncbi:MAG TPA: aldose epimerase family protein [Pirellulaceae bacterium]|nr:aldose epimerase family protein [Pirellulaceae bacterium]